MVANTTKIEFYDYGPIDSYNAPYNVIAGPRGSGKTFGFVDKCIRDFTKRREQFFYLRRYKPDIAKSAPLFFDANAFKYPHMDFKTNGGIAYVASAETRGQKKREWDVIGYFGALSTAQQFKSVPFPGVTKIGYDEFILEKGNAQYLRDEVTAFNNFYSTVDRYRERRGQKPVRAYLMANSVTSTNPFFIEWDIRPDTGEEWQKRFNGFLIAHLHRPNELFRDQVMNTQYGKFLQASDPDYVAYAVDNKFADSHLTLIGPKPATAKYRYSLEMPRQDVSVWYDLGTRTYYVQRKRPKQEHVFTLDRAGVAPNVVYLEYGSKVLSAIRTAWNHGRVVCDEPATRNLFVDIFKRT